MKVYVVTEEYENTLDYEDYDHGREYHCVCSTFDKAIEAIENIINSCKESEEYDNFEGRILAENERTRSELDDGSIVWSVAKAFFDGYSVYDIYDVTYYITETELI